MCIYFNYTKVLKLHFHIEHFQAFTKQTKYWADVIALMKILILIRRDNVADSIRLIPFA